MMRKYLIVLLLIYNSIDVFSQVRYTLNGYVKDFEDGEELIGVNITVRELTTGTTTNVYGFYSITLDAGKYQLIYSYIGYGSKFIDITLDSNREINVDLELKAFNLEEVVINADKLDANVKETSMSRINLDVRQIEKLPALFGEPDIIKIIQMLPGVISAGEGTSSYYVRGGSADQNLILIDEAPIYDPSHLFGLFSVFNADVIKDSELFKGGIPPRYGGRLSSILDIRTKDGNNKKFAGSAGIGALASKLLLEGPIKKGKSSYIISARRSYVDLILAAANEDARVQFYDINAKINWKHNNNNRFFLAVYLGRDAFEFDKEFGFDWGNATATFRWNHLFNSRLFSNTTLIASQFDYGLESLDPVQGFEWKSHIKQVSFKQDLSFYVNPRNEMHFGYHLTYMGFSPAELRPNVEGSIFITKKLDLLYALDHALYLGNIQTLNSKLKLDYGVRLSIFQNIGESTVIQYRDPKDNINIDVTGEKKYKPFENIKTFINPEPRFSMRYLINNESSLKLSYNRMVQNTHLVSSGTVPMPFNTWYPSSPYLKPQKADQLVLGYFKNLKNNQYELSAEVYYKDLNDITDFADNAQIFFNDHLTTEFRQGKAWSYGLELYAKKNKGKLTGFAGYTLSKTEKKIPTVNLGNTFLANYDRRHNLSLSGTYFLNNKWTFGLNFVYNTGRPITVPSGRYEFQNYNVDLITERNGFKLPDFHRMDLSATLTQKKNVGRKVKSHWIFSLYNVYSRKNPFGIITQIKKDGNDNIIGDGTQKEAKIIYLFPILPSVSYNIKF